MAGSILSGARIDRHRGAGRGDRTGIAGAFLGDCISDPIGLAVIESIQRIVRAMDIQSIACAIDNPLVLAKVRQPGVDFGRPRQWRPLEQIAAVN